MGDDFIYNPNQHCEIAEMIKTFEQSEAKALVTCIEKPENMLHRYGIAKLAASNGFNYLEALIEKPAPGSAPSNLANISKSICSSGM